MLDDAHATLKTDRGAPERATGRAGAVAAAIGVAAAVGAALLLWSSEGGAVFLAQAFAALAACF